MLHVSRNAAGSAAFIVALSLLSVGLGSCCCCPCDTAPAPLQCVDFEDPPVNSEYAVGQTFQDSGVTITVREYTSPAQTYMKGRIVPNNGVIGTGQAGKPANAHFDFAFGRIGGVEFQFYETGGNVHLSVNNDLRTPANFADLNGMTVGGCTVAVATQPVGSNNHRGTVTITGIIEELQIGGQELTIDDVCPAPAP